MSADNGVYILKTGKQYRVKQQFAIDNLFWDAKERSITAAPHPDMIFEMFGDVPYTYNKDKALRIAHNIADRLPVCEYGVSIIDAGISWGQVLRHVGITTQFKGAS